MTPERIERILYVLALVLALALTGVCTLARADAPRCYDYEEPVNDPDANVLDALKACEGRAYIADDTYPINCECLRACLAERWPDAEIPEDCIGLCD